MLADAGQDSEPEGWQLGVDWAWRWGWLGGIGFTMSIFITNLAFTGQAELINATKIAVFLALLLAGTLGFFWLRVLGKSPSN